MADRKWFPGDLRLFSLQSEVESWVAVTPIVTAFLGSVERRSFVCGRATSCKVWA